jgi:RimJ/RimL family protein N-acetyltransferase
MKERSNVKNIIAEIVAGNVISRKAFQKAGYVYSHNIQRKNKQITIYRSNL